MNPEQLSDAECQECDTSGAWRKFVSTEQTGRKGGRSRNPTERHVFRCLACSREGKVFVDGVDGTVTFAGALRGSA